MNNTNSLDSVDSADCLDRNPSTPTKLSQPSKLSVPTIGIEVHAQLLTKTKLFCSCPIDWQAEPNSLTCPTCLGMPGTLPVLNKYAVELAIKSAIALNFEINKESIFARKNYFYPDLPKGYQISQYDRPLAYNGFLDIGLRKIRLRRLHLEEDAGKLIHQDNCAIVDFNRCGIPLIEIVTEPDITSAEEAVEYLKKLHQILKYLKVCTGDMEKGHMRCEPNISINYGTRTEIKNLNSFKAVEEGINYEINRQLKAISEGKKIKHITLLWNEKARKTQEMRGKEQAEDYRYFPEPDLPPLVISDRWTEEIKVSIPELPEEKVKRFIKNYNLKPEDVKILCNDPVIAEYYEQIVSICKLPQDTANFIISEFLSYTEKVRTEEFKLSPDNFAELLLLISKGTITRATAKNLFPEIAKTNISPLDLINKRGLTQIEDLSLLEKTIEEVLASHPDEVKRYKEGKHQLIDFFVGEVMKKTKGKASHKIVNELLRKILII